MMNISNCNKKILVILLIVVILVILAVVAYFIYNKTDIENFEPTTESSTTTPNTSGSSTTTVPNATGSSTTTVPNATGSSTTTVPNATGSSITTVPNDTGSSTTVANTTESNTTMPNATGSSTTAPNTTIANSQMNMGNSANALLNGIGTAAQNGIRTELGIHGVNGNLGNKDNNLLGNNIYVSPMNNDTLYNPQAKLSQLGKITSSFFPMIKIAQ